MNRFLQHRWVTSSAEDLYTEQNMPISKVNENGETELKEILVMSSEAYMKTNSNFKF